MLAVLPKFLIQSRQPAQTLPAPAPRQPSALRSRRRKPPPLSRKRKSLSAREGRPRRGVKEEHAHQGPCAVAPPAWESAAAVGDARVLRAESGTSGLLGLAANLGGCRAVPSRAEPCRARSKRFAPPFRLFQQLTGGACTIPVTERERRLRGSAAERPPSAQGLVPESWDRVPHGAPCLEPASPPSVCLCLSLSLCLS